MCRGEQNFLLQQRRQTIVVFLPSVRPRPVGQRQRDTGKPQKVLFDTVSGACGDQDSPVTHGTAGGHPEDFHTLLKSF